MDHLLDLNEELDLADASAAPLEIVPGTDDRAMSEMVANPRRDLPNLVDHPEVERPPPYERLDGVEKPLPKRPITCGSSGPDEGRSLPRQRARFVMRNGRVHRQRDGSDFGRRTQPEINSLHVPVLGALLQDFDDPPAHPNRSLTSVVAAAPGHCFRIEQQQEVDVRAVVELAAAKLAHGDDCEAVRSGAWNALRHGQANRFIDRRVCKARQQRSDRFERKLARKIPECRRQSDALPLAAKRGFEIASLRGEREFGGCRGTAAEESIDNLGAGADCIAQERRVDVGAAERFLPVSFRNFSTHQPLFTVLRPIPTKLPCGLARLPS